MMVMIMLIIMIVNVNAFGDSVCVFDDENKDDIKLAKLYVML